MIERAHKTDDKCQIRQEKGISMIKRWLQNRKHTKIAHDLYCALVDQARNPSFYEKHGVADTLEGRLDMILLHMFLVVRYLQHSKTDTQPLIQILQEVMIRDIDRSLREIGVGDMNVGKQMKGVGASLLGRLKAYADAFNAEDKEQALSQVVIKNIYRTEIDDVNDVQVKAIVSYIIASLESHVTDRNLNSYSTGKLVFPEWG